MISTKRRIILLEMKKDSRDYSKYSATALTNFIMMEYKCTYYIARKIAKDLKPKKNGSNI